MAKVRLNLKDMTITQKVPFGRNVVTKTTGNSNFTTPNPALATISTLIDTLESKAEIAQIKRQESQQATTELHAAEDAFDQGLTQFGNYVEGITGGDTAKIQSSGLDVRATAAPIGPMPKPDALAATIGDLEGECDLVWHRVRGAGSYLIQKSVDPITATSWQQAGVSTKSKFSVTGLTSGSKYWFRVAAVGSEGPGPWSDPATSLAA